MIEGLWWVDEGAFSFEKRDNWRWTIMIRQPDFVTEDVFRWACDSLNKKKPELEAAKAYFSLLNEGLCVQIMHIGPYSKEPQTIEKLENFILENALKDRLGSGGKHHEIYLSDPRKVSSESMKTVLRHPVENRNF